MSGEDMVAQLVCSAVTDDRRDETAPPAYHTRDALPAHHIVYLHGW